MEPSSTGGVALVLSKLGSAKVALAIAGFMGAMLSLGWIKDLSRPQMFVAVVTGFACSWYCTPLAMHYLSLPPEQSDLRYGIAFLLGLFAMHLIPLAKHLIKKRAGAAS